jgi:cytochrome c biogenesis protein CcmG, thiol:disulfide interchange protein DsbE
MQTQNLKRFRIIALIVAPLIVMGLIVTLLQFFGRNEANADPTTTNAVLAEQLTAPESLAESAQNSETGTESATVPTLTPVAPEDIVAQVNQRVIPIDLLNVAQATDRAITTLLVQPPSMMADILEIVVNGELVWQQAEQAGFTLPNDQITAALDRFLTSQDKTISELELSLAQENMSLGDFETYYGRLIVINGFSQQQAQAQGTSIADYVANLQTEAQISFGPAAAIAAGEPEPEITAEIETADQSDQSSQPDQTDDPRGTTTGQLAPVFDLPALNYAPADFLSLADLAGKPVLLSFWTTWCPYCRAQTPILVEAYGRYKDQVEFVGINVRESQDAVQSYANQNLMPYPVLLDTNGQTADTYSVNGFPTTYFLDASGRVIARQIGQLKPEQVEQYMAQLLSSTDP